MGNIAETLGLGGAGQTASALPKMASDPLAVLLGGGAATGPGGMSDAIGNYQAPQVAAPQADPSGITVTGDNWQPHKRTTLGTIGDFLSVLAGGSQVFQASKDESNLREAMQGVFSDPKQAIERIARIKGHAGDAWKMYNEYTDNERAQGGLERQNRALDMRNDDYMFQQVAGMMGAANDKNWGQMRDLAIKRGQARGVDVSQLIPEEYDPTSVEFMRFGAIKPKDREKLKQGDRRLDITEDHNHTTEAQAATNEAGRNNRNATNEGGRNNRAAAAREAAAARQAAALAAKGKKQPDGSHFVKTPQGDMSLSPSGQTGRITRDDGRIEIWQKASPGHWVKINGDARKKDN
jgi:hypothetical protein